MKPGRARRPSRFGASEPSKTETNRRTESSDKRPGCFQTRLLPLLQTAGRRRCDGKTRVPTALQSHLTTNRGGGGKTDALASELAAEQTASIRTAAPRERAFASCLRAAGKHKRAGAEAPTDVSTPVIGARPCRGFCSTAVFSENTVLSPISSRAAAFHRSLVEEKMAPGAARLRPLPPRAQSGHAIATRHRFFPPGRLGERGEL